MTPKIEELGRVVGRGVRMLRAQRQMSLEDVALAARDLGYRWSASRVNALQRGTRDPKLSTLLMLAHVFDCAVTEFLHTDADWISFDDLVVDAGELSQWLGAGDLPTCHAANPPDRAEWVASRGFGSEGQMIDTIGLSTEILHPMSTRNTLADRRTAQALDLDIDMLNAITWELFDGRTLTEARDIRAEATGRSPGDVTTELRAQIAAHIDSWSDERRNPTHYPPDPPA